MTQYIRPPAIQESFRLESEPAANRPIVRMRDYQVRAADAIMHEFETVGTTLVVMPTGTGKTILFSEIIRRFHPGKAMVLAHREELIFQAQAKITHVTGYVVGIEMADLRSNGSLTNMADVIVSTIQTQVAGNDGGRMTQFDPAAFVLLIVDEAHHATSATYRRTIDYYRQNPRIKILGVTATPDRADEEALGQVYETVAFDYEILDAIRDGWLVPIHQRMVEVEGLDFSGCKTTAGDLNGGDLAEVLEFEKNLHGIADPAFQIAGDRRALMFAASVAQAERLAEILNRHRAGCADWVCGKTDKDERRALLAKFSRGETQFIVNVGVLTEGFDDAGVEMIFMARPTKSRSLYAQMAGRATRPLPGVVDGHERDGADQRTAAIAASKKPSCTIVDFVGNSGRHKLMTTADILGGNVSDEACARAAKTVKDAGTEVDMRAALEMADEEIKAEAERRKREDEAKRAKLLAKAKYTTRAVNPFDVFEIEPREDRGWDKGKVLSDKQRDMLLRQGIDPAGMNYAAAKQLLNEIFRRWDGKLCSFKQANLLKRFGFPHDVSMADAKATIDKIAASGWKLRYSPPVAPAPQPVVAVDTGDHFEY